MQEINSVELDSTGVNDSLKAQFIQSVQETEIFCHKVKELCEEHLETQAIIRKYFRTLVLS